MYFTLHQYFIQKNYVPHTNQLSPPPLPREGSPQSLRNSALHQLSYCEPHWFVRYHYEISALIIVLHSTKQTLSTEIACFVICSIRLLH
jgi:hypothetical protein